MRESNVPQDLLTLHVVDSGDSLLIYMVGECDIETVPSLMDELSKAVQSGKHVILDVHLLTYMDSTGISTIASAHESLSEKGAELRIVGSHGIFSKIVKLTRLDQIIDFYETVEDARERSNPTRPIPPQIPPSSSS